MKMISVHFLARTGPSKSGPTLSLSCIPTILPKPFPFNRPFPLPCLLAPVSSAVL